VDVGFSPVLLLGSAIAPAVTRLRVMTTRGRARFSISYPE
jgi:hypothetical protein